MNRLKQLSDKIFASMSMYLGVFLALLGLFGVAFTQSLMGSLAFTVVELLVSFAIFVAVSFGANYLFAYLCNVKAHYLSALITGGILFFLFSPTISFSQLLIYALIAMIAMASKYLLVWRGRHIFNPAAVAAVIISLTGLGFASWWGASMPLAVFATIFGLVILYKTQRLQMAGVFLIAYILIMSLAALVAGQPVLATLASSLTAWWPLYFVGFMLSEPLTLPPRRHQYFFEAGIIAALIALHPSLGSIYLTPEMALLVGNVLAAIFAKRAGIVLTLVRRQKHTGDQEEFRFRSNRRLPFLPGQYLELMVPHGKTDLRGERRMFTIASAPNQDELIIATRYAEKSSTFKTALRALKKGDTLSVTGIRGDFLLPKDPSRKLLFIAGGIGITPFHAHLQALQAGNDQRDIILIYALRKADEMLFKDVLFSKQYPIKVILVSPDGDDSKLPIVNADRIDEMLIKNTVADISDRTVYISGAPQMVAALSKSVRRLGARRIKTDDFTGY